MTRGGSTTRWRTVRAFVLQRDGYKCRAHQDGWCVRSGAKPHTCKRNAPLTGGLLIAGQAHHTLGAWTGDDPAYLVASCPPCNQAIGKPRQHNPEGRSLDDW